VHSRSGDRSGAFAVSVLVLALLVLVGCARSRSEESSGRVAERQLVDRLQLGPNWIETANGQRQDQSGFYTQAVFWSGSSSAWSDLVMRVRESAPGDDVLWEFRGSIANRSNVRSMASDFENSCRVRISVGVRPWGDNLAEGSIPKSPEGTGLYVTAHCSEQ
jgi:hypothetical protein